MFEHNHTTTIPSKIKLTTSHNSSGYAICQLQPFSCHFRKDFNGNPPILGRCSVKKTHLGIDSMDAVQRKSTFFAGKDAFSGRRLNNPTTELLRVGVNKNIENTYMGCKWM